MNMGTLIPGMPPHIWDLCAKLGKYPGWCTVGRSPIADDAIGVNVRWEKLPLATARQIQQSIALLGYRGGSEVNPSVSNSLMHLEAMGILCSNGPKVFTLNDEQCEALEHVDARLAVGDYRQPFPSMLVRFPVRFIQTVRRENLFTAPEFIVVRHYDRPEEGPAMFLGGINSLRGPLGTDEKVTNCIMCVHGPERTIENSINKILDSTENEARGMARLYRVAVSAMLLLTHHSFRCESSNLGELDRARRRLKRGVRTAENAYEVVTHVYCITWRFGRTLLCGTFARRHRTPGGPTRRRTRIGGVGIGDGRQERPRTPAGTYSCGPASSVERRSPGTWRTPLPRTAVSPPRPVTMPGRDGPGGAAPRPLLGPLAGLARSMSAAHVQPPPRPAAGQVYRTPLPRSNSYPLPT